MPNDPLPELINSRVAAAATGRAQRTLRHWDATGRLTVYRDPVTKRRYFSLEEIRRLAPQPVRRVRDAVTPPVPTTPSAESAS